MNAASSIRAPTHVAAGRTFETHQHPQTGRLAGPVRAEETADLALFDRQGEVLDRGDLAELLPETIDGHHWHAGHGDILVRARPRMGAGVDVGRGSVSC
jgi:hypothetical protein